MIAVNRVSSRGWYGRMVVALWQRPQLIARCPTFGFCPQKEERPTSFGWGCSMITRCSFQPETVHLLSSNEANNENQNLYSNSFVVFCGSVGRDCSVNCTKGSRS